MSPDPIKFEQATRLYNELWEESEDTGDGYHFWEGYLGGVGARLGIPVGSFRVVKEILESLGLIRVTQRGNRRQSTILRLYASESITDTGKGGSTGSTRHENISPNPLTPSALYARLAAEVEAARAWREQLGEVNIVEALRAIDKRITKIERELNVRKAQETTAAKNDTRTTS